MTAVVHRTLPAFVLLVLLITGTWESHQVAYAQSQTVSPPDVPLYPGLTWSSQELSRQNIRINIQGDSISLSGERYEAREQFSTGLSQEVLDYYSNAALAKSGWTSYDAFDGADGVHFVFHHESGVYLSVEFLKCPEAPSSTCLAVWKSEQVQQTPILTPGTTPEVGEITTFGKTSPVNGATGVDPRNTTLSWQAYPNADKYSYCVKIDSECEKGAPEWTSSYSRSVTLTNLAFDKTYYWQVKATTCELCIPKPWVYADNDTAWRFKTKTGTGSKVTILGNAGVGGAVLSYTDGTARSATADSTGAYSLEVSYNWTGTITPTKLGYLFSPPSASFTNLTAPQTIQNFTAIPVYVISGNTGVPGVTLSYVNGTPQTVVSDANGNYSIGVPAGWSGTVTPSRTAYVFSPASRTYSNLASNQTAQNYVATVATFTISGNAGTAGVTLRYWSGGFRTVVSDTNGNYSITVPYSWGGRVIPSKTGFVFSPVDRTYINVVTNQTAQNYTAIPLHTISGNVGVAGATLSYADGTPKTVISQANGSYSLTVQGAWTGTITPTHECFTFNPPSRNYSSLTSDQPGQNYAPALKTGCADVTVQIGGANQSRLGLRPKSSSRVNINGLNNGPVKITSSNSLLAGERVISRINGVNISFSEMIGLPKSQLDRIYWLPWYNTVGLDTQLRFANVSGQPATVRLFIGGVEKTTGCTPSSSPYTLAAGTILRVSCAGVSGGPVEFRSDQNIVASARMIYNAAGGVQTSYSEMMALPNKQLSNIYWLPVYNNVDLDTQLRFANVSTSPATVRLFIGGVEKTTGCTPSSSPYNVAAGASLRVSCAGVNGGPVEIRSTQNIVASARSIYIVNGVQTSYSETMAMPGGLLNTSYWLPVYNNVDLDTQLRFANVSGQPSTVRIFIGGVEKTTGCTPSSSPYSVAAGASLRVSCAGVNGGPVEIRSTQNIVASMRVVYKANNIPTSFSEVMGLPNSILDTIYWFPWYNNVDLDTQLRFGRP